MHFLPEPYILAITDKLGDPLTNGSQVMGQAVLEALSKWYKIKVIVQQVGNLSQSFKGQVIQLDRLDDNIEAIVDPILQNPPKVIYNFGNTVFSSEVTAIIQSLTKNVPIINHFQLVLSEYAKGEGFNEGYANQMGINCQVVAERALYNIFPSSSELNRVIRLGWHVQYSNNCVLKNVFIPAGTFINSPPAKATLTFMAAGRFSDYVKGADILYRAFSQYYSQDNTAHLLVASDDRRFTELLKSVPKSAWTYLGWLTREELHARFLQADIVIVPSRYEPFGLVAVEAMAMGKPVIAFAIDGLSEIIHHQQTGWLIDPNEGSLGLRVAMQQAALNKSRFPAMGEMCKAIVKQEFSLELLVKQLRKIFDNTLALECEGVLYANKSL